MNRTAEDCLRSICADFVAIVLNWLALGAVLMPAHSISAVVPVFELNPRSYVFLIGISLLHAALITLLGYVDGMYKIPAEMPATKRSIGKAVWWGSFILCFAYALQGSHWTVVGFVCLAGFAHFVAMWSWRCWSHQSRFLGTVTTHNVLIVGSGPAGRQVADYIERHPNRGRKFCGFLDDEKPLGDDVIGRVSDLALMARKGFVDEVLLAAPHDGKLAARVLQEAKRLRLDLEIVPELYGCASAEPDLEHVGGLPVICVHAERLPAVGLLMKRVMDAVGATLGLILISPVLAAIALLIKLDSRGPVLYVAKRAGRKGRLFHCYKFRTMGMDADQRKNLLRTKNLRSGPIFKVLDDPRITRVGRFLRRYSLDELPQLWNVLSGDMSLVGPRPHPADEFAAYDVGHLARLDITPGLTGLWQVSARRESSFDRAMELDREYIRTWSLGLDLKILLKTVLAVAQGSGS